MPRKKTIDLNKANKAEKQMIIELLRLKERAINKIMIPLNEITAFRHDRTMDEVFNVYRDQRFSRYPVYFREPDQIVGVLFIKDIIPLTDEYLSYPVVEFVRFPYFIYEDRKASDVFFELQKLRVSMGIVIDEFGSVSGLVTVEDIIEEIVGDIEDEFDEKKKPFIQKLTESEFYVNCRIELEDFADYFNIMIDEDDVTTLNGFLLKKADRIPKVGEQLQYKNLTFSVVEGTRRKVNAVKVKIQ